MAVVDSECKYVLVDVGAKGRQSDGGIFKDSPFGHHLTEGCLDIPALGSLSGTSTNVPYAFVGDEAFQLRKDFMRPYPARQLNDGKRIFNYRLSRARRCAENAFDITAARWRILLRTINLDPSNVDFVVKAAWKTVSGNVGGCWRQGVQQVPDNNFFFHWLQHGHETTMVMQLLPENSTPATFLAVLARCLGSGVYQD
ncbi:hypothetical protein MTO96_040315 [Rhipicephalus appendiculatus]